MTENDRPGNKPVESAESTENDIDALLDEALDRADDGEVRYHLRQAILHRLAIRDTDSNEPELIPDGGETNSTYHDDERHWCEICGTPFVTVRGLRQHDCDRYRSVTIVTGTHRTVRGPSPVSVEGVGPDA